jgi:hypothetical protein
MSGTSTASVALTFGSPKLTGWRNIQDASYAAMAAKSPLIIALRLITAMHPAVTAIVAVDIIPLCSIWWGKGTIVNIKVRHKLRKTAIFFSDTVLAVLVGNELLGLCFCFVDLD